MRECWQHTKNYPSYVIVPGRRYRVCVRRNGRTCLRSRTVVHPAWLRAMAEYRSEAREWWGLPADETPGP